MSPVRKYLWAFRRTLGLSPMQQVMRELERRGVRLRSLDALELFAHSGFLHSRDYHPHVARLEAWEIDPHQEAALRRNLPGAEVKITDSYEEIKKTHRKYNLILLDAPDSVYGEHDQYCEHFLMLPEVFRAAADSTVLILNVVPGYPNGTPRPSQFTTKHLDYRRQFYGTDHPACVPIADMIPRYRREIESHGFELEWHFSLPRTRKGRVHYLVLKIKTRGSGCG
jgi:hypothetical protein